MLEEENKKETQESEQVPAAERIQEPESVQSQESEPAQDQTPKPVRESAGHSRRRQGEDKSQDLRFGVIRRVQSGGDQRERSSGSFL